MEIELKGVCKAFDGLPVLTNLSWRLTDGDFWRLDGASGIGKTTLLHLLMGLETPDRGTLAGLNGVRVTAAFQEPRLCGWLTARENIALVCNASIAEIDAALTSLLPDECLNRPASTLSGGMQRRVALVRALLPDSDLVLLDEPFSGLDVPNRTLALAYLMQARRGRALVLVSHDALELHCRTLTLDRDGGSI